MPPSKLRHVKFAHLLRVKLFHLPTEAEHFKTPDARADPRRRNPRLHLFKYEDPIPPQLLHSDGPNYREVQQQPELVVSSNVISSRGDSAGTEPDITSKGEGKLRQQ